MSGSKLYVGNIPFGMTEDELTQVFSTHGAVTRATVVLDRDTGRPRGFAFVEMETADAANAAKDALDGSEMGGRNIRVDSARERSDRPRTPRRDRW